MVAERIDSRNDDVLVGGKDRDEVSRRLLVPVCFAGIERRRGGRSVGDVEPLDTVDFCHLAAGGEARRLLARHVIGVLDKNRLVPGFPLFSDEFERTGPDRFRDLLVGVGLGQPLRHHERHIARQLAERIEDQRERRFQLYCESLVVDRLHPADGFHQLLAERVPLAPAFDRSDAIGGTHRLAVMPLQTIAQDEAVGQLIVAGIPAIDHLRLRLEILVEREQRIEHQITEISRDIGCRPDRIDASQIRLRDEPQSLLRSALGPPDRRHDHGEESCCCRPSQCLR